MDEEERGPANPDAETVRLLREAHDYILTLPAEERHIAALAAEGLSVWEIAQQMRMSDAAVAHVLDRVVALLSGRPIEPVESGGLGADTDPGVSGGYDPEPYGP
jgi:DNA-directed RNA polymerase specialized sigma24 family protein